MPDPVLEVELVELVLDFVFEPVELVLDFVFEPVELVELVELWSVKEPCLSRSVTP